MERREREATTWLTAWESLHWREAIMLMGRLSRAIKGSRNRREVTFTNSRLMISVFEVVLKDSFLAKTSKMERFTIKERRRRRKRRENSTNTNILSLSSLFVVSSKTLAFN